MVSLPEFNAFFLYLAINAMSFYVVSGLLPGFRIRDVLTSLLVALVFGVLSAVSCGFLFWMGMISGPTLELTINVGMLTSANFNHYDALWTFGLTLALIMVTDSLLEDFEIDSWLSAIVGSLIFSVINGILTAQFM